ncbi:DUF1564 domain-containing protein [Leptospira gomenensis]|uniref:DUF1564 domain-containing protein n=1 Tax=Leptospira gomenensis TaxID=2484974 RepID=A0A5F1Z1V7_9LEPT|nr:DUF1564 domain-containing protein [Leptospira gomenensis]TGK32655.1 DUF1564 domain-containing protein [Leptospira gomenensis]TGK36803.1 DUF1564 domain-containing protein [Leptospira gomenensis]TGK46374.1 DUF1564 domain-containing protein [Leptospira gomenensis]TGK65318.1 DUF1564 domain-containing protein [Leptospira gomenensis]
METIFLNTEEKIQSAMTERKNRVVSLLIPESYFVKLSNEDQRYLVKRVPELLRRYAKFMASRSRINDEGITTLYQKNQGKLKKLNVRMNTGFWSLLGVLANAHGVSRCYLFNFLLFLDRVEVGDSIAESLNEGVPTFHDVYSYIWELDLIHNTITRFLRFSPNPIHPLYAHVQFPWVIQEDNT